MNAAIAPAAATLETLELAPGYAALGATFVERRDPTPLPEPYLVAFNPDVAALVGLDSGEAERPEFVRLAAGCARFSRVEPFAAVYAGHQFGTFVPRLGDGRAISLGEVRGPNGTAYEWQVKGAGPTAFSRFGDGRAVLRSTIREYLCGEAMAALGIPTTRALAIAGSPEAVFRETSETAAVLTRIAPSMVRFGTFEFFAHRGEVEAVKTLADYVVSRFFPDAAAREGSAERYEAFLTAVVERTAALVARWQAVGFSHGVMNTDNMSILGLTLDYGPYGFLDRYEPHFICNHTDVAGRYAFDQQPGVGLWNARRLADALASLVDEAGRERAIARYADAFRAEFTRATYAKFGLANARDEDVAFFTFAFERLASGGADHTNAFRTLSRVPREPDARADADFRGTFDVAADADALLARYRDRLAHETRDDAARADAMRAVNPAIVLRNYLAENAIRAAQAGDFGEIARLHAALRAPFDDLAEGSTYAEPPPTWARHLEVSCSS